MPVTGIELSRPMIEQLRTKAGEAAIPVIAGDMAAARAPGRYTLVWVRLDLPGNAVKPRNQCDAVRLGETGATAG